LCHRTRHLVQVTWNVHSILATIVVALELSVTHRCDRSRPICQNYYRYGCSCRFREIHDCLSILVALDLRDDRLLTEMTSSLNR
uniref:Secreted protein n=1 Tax=Haemonchus placei TaxID=6290 RepID=A0A0N4W3D3_HAEPC